MLWLKALKARTCILAFLFLNLFYAQENLVQNPSFEENIKCSDLQSNINDCKYWYQTIKPGTPDYFNPCNNPITSSPTNSFGYQSAKSGSCYAGFAIFRFYLSNFREYLSVGLKKNLMKDRYYELTFYVSLAELSKFAAKEIGAYFSEDSLKETYPLWPPYVLNYTPQVVCDTLIEDTLNWVKIQKCFKAQGNEKFLTIASFVDDNHLTKKQIKPCSLPECAAYYFIDDVSVVEISPARAAMQDTIELCPGQSFTLGTESVSEAAYEWYSNVPLSCTQCPYPVVSASNATVVLVKKQCQATLYDTVYLKLHVNGPPAYAGPDALLCRGQSVTLGGGNAHALRTYTWQPPQGLSCTHCPMPVASPDAPTSYTLTLTECGTQSTDEVKVEVQPCEMLLPQAITLNRDGKNDLLEVKIPFAQQATLQVFNRWGNEVYSASEAAPEGLQIVLRWDGTHQGQPLPAGVYFYLVRGTDLNGKPFEYKQFVHLMR
ncbi:MAG: gliding motility-associated C-terminal domain-containing protein [Bacteroidia bacterium]|nr:gliding motility-associated C-terminal domain-containing protein [Bacteroidia bacterium]